MAKSTRDDSCPDVVLALVERFAQHIEAYKRPDYNETEVRREFIDPMFKALGWDIDNKQGHAEAYKDVIHEDAVKIGGSTKAPDYGFRIGGVRKFFVEAKKPAEDIKQKQEHAYQLRRYAWSAKLPISILTDFEEFAVYDCSKRPKPTDKASTARVLYLTCDQYADRWGDIASVFSKDAILTGSFDKYAASARRKRGTAEVDDEFLKEIESWREELARNIALRNNLSVRDLNFAVSKIIDRIIFLRMCEDRGVENYAHLGALRNAPRIYPRLVELFRRADDRYNSGLFHFSREAGRAEAPDELTPDLTIDDKVLKGILSRLYYPESPYEFSVMPPEILGQVYEQFLGKVIRLTPGGRAKVEEKPEVKKAGGVYYTPRYIVDYIVKHTVGKLLEGKTPDDLGPMLEQRKPKKLRASKKTSARKKATPTLRILDPACGSGSFLLGAYQYLLQWQLDWYVAHDPEQWAKKPNPPVYQSPKADPSATGPIWRLTVAERKRILVNNIYGVDIDPQAVEVTKLSLLLEVLKGETQQTLEHLYATHERALPDLADNIKCGNSLIGPDFYENRQMDLLDEEQRYKINAFDWQAEFPQVFPNRDGEGESGGFDAVIGNPPYRRELDYKHMLDEIACTRFGKRYRAPRMDLWYYFVHRSLQLLGPHGALHFITNAYWVSGTGAGKLIAAMRETAHIDEIFFLGKLRVFNKVSGQHMLFRVAKTTSDASTTVKLAQPEGQTIAEPFVRGAAPVLRFQKTPKQLFLGEKVDLQPPADAILTKLQRFPQLSNLGIIRQGIAENPASINKKTNAKYGNRWDIGEGVFALRVEEVQRLHLPPGEAELLRPYHDLSDVGRYSISDAPSLCLIYSNRHTCPDIASTFPTIREHLDRFRVIMEARRETRKGSNRWWHLHWPRDEALWRSSKIIAVQMAARPSFVPSMPPVYVPFSINVFVPDNATSEHLNYLTGLLNSRLMWKWYQHHAKRRGIGLEINGNVLGRTPIRAIDFSDSTDKSRHDGMVDTVQQMLDLRKALATARIPTDKTAIQRQIEVTDRRIDQLVYELYDLTDDEIRIVEEATK